MKALYDLKDKIHAELDETARKPELSARDFEYVHMLTDTIKNIDKICMLEDDQHSQAGEWTAHGNSYASRGMHYVRGHYSRDDESMASRDSRKRYSYDEGTDRFLDELEEMLRNTSNEKVKSAIMKAIHEIQHK